MRFADGEGQMDREQHIESIASALACAGLPTDRCLPEARRAVELAERVGAAEGAASPRATNDVIREHIEAVMWLATRGEPIPQDEPRMREVMRMKLAREVFATLGVAFPWG